ncbi:MAG: hypothetical protein ABI837_21570, partial [Acidobacteriota bacterium]
MGILFTDGTILTTAAGLVSAAESGKAENGTAEGGRGDRQRASAPDGGNSVGGTVVRIMQPPALPDVATSAPPRPGVNFAPANQFVVNSTGVSVGTTNPAYKLYVTGDLTLASNLKLPATTASTGVISIGSLRFAHIFPVNNTYV